MQEKCPYSLRVAGAVVADWTIPRPSPETAAMFHNVSRNSLLFLQAARIQPESKEHKELKTTIQVLHRQYLHAFKYVEEQASEVNQLIAKAQIQLPWLRNYEDGWPARIYLKRYVDGRRPHLMCTKYARQRQLEARMSKSQGSHKVPTRKLEVLASASDTPLRDHDSIVREFLGSLTPSLEHHLDAFVKLGLKDQKTLQAFLSWSQVFQAQFLDEGCASGVLQLTSLEKKGLLVGSGLLTQRGLERSLDSMVKPGCFPL